MTQKSPSKNGRSSKSSTASNGSKSATNGKRRKSMRPSRGGGDTFASGLGNPQAPDIIDSLTETTELPDEVMQLLRTEFHKGHALGNYKERDIIYRKFVLKNTVEFIESHFPPKQSIWQGEVRKKAGLGDGRRAMPPELRLQIRDAGDLAYSYSTRSGPEDGMAQQRILADQTQERRVVEERTDEGNSWLSKLVG